MSYSLLTARKLSANLYAITIAVCKIKQSHYRLGVTQSVPRS